MSRGRGAERWDMEFASSDPDYKMEIEGSEHASSARMRCCKVKIDDTLVCAAHTQGFEHLGRPSYMRPFMGVQIKTKLNLAHRHYGLYEEPLTKATEHVSVAAH